MFHYRYIYKTVFGTKWQDLDAEDDEAADRIFWEDKLSDLNEIVMVEKSSLPVDEKGGGSADQSDDEGLRCAADHLDLDEHPLFAHVGEPLLEEAVFAAELADSQQKPSQVNGDVFSRCHERIVPP